MARVLTWQNTPAISCEISTSGYVFGSHCPSLRWLAQCVTHRFLWAAFGRRLGLGVCVPHSCSCGENVDAWGQHAFVCKHASGRTQRQHVLNDFIASLLLRREFRFPRRRPASIVTVLTAGRCHLSAMAVRPDLDLGYHGCNHVGRLLPPSLFRHCSCCSWGCSFQEGVKYSDPLPHSHFSRSL